MQKCPNCNHNNRIGVVFCEQCGTSLIGEAPLGTKSIDAKAGELGQHSTLRLGSEVFKPGMLLKIVIEGGNPLLLKFNKELVFGRKDPATGVMPDVDLTPFAGFRMGVSRKHAVIRPGESNHLEIWDLGSSNGSYLNGVRLAPHHPNPIHDGDQIRLGQMVINIYFQSSGSETNGNSDPKGNISDHK